MRTSPNNPVRMEIIAGTLEILKSERMSKFMDKEMFRVNGEAFTQSQIINILETKPFSLFAELVIRTLGELVTGRINPLNN